MSNNEFDEFINQIYHKPSGSYSPGSSNPYSARNKAIDDLIKSLTEQAEKYCDEIDQKRKGKYQPKFTAEDFEKVCTDLGLENE